MAKENGQVDEAEMMEDSEIEKKIAEAKSANKELGLPDIDDEEGRADSEEDGEGGTAKAKEPKMNKSKASPKAEGKDDEEDEEEYEESKKTKKEGMPPWLNKDKKDDDEEDEDEEDKEESKKEEIEVNVEEDVAALISGEELSEEFKSKAATIFEAAVKSKIAKIRKQIREESKKEQEERIESMQTEMTENMDKYLNYATKEWM